MQRVYSSDAHTHVFAYMYTAYILHFILFHCLLINYYLKVIKNLVMNYKNYKLFSMLYAVERLYSRCSDSYDNTVPRVYMCTTYENTNVFIKCFIKSVLFAILN